MGTRSLTHVKQGNQTIVTTYRQYDGYPRGIGNDIARFLSGRKVVNGWTTKDEGPRHNFNGMGCLAAALVGHLKDGKIGNVYVHPPDDGDCGEEYRYTISHDGNGIILKCEADSSDGWNVLYDGPVDGFDGAKFE